MNIPPPDFSPLDMDEYKHQARLLLALHSARPVLHEGRQQFLHTIRAQQSGGRIVMDIYLAGATEAIDSSKITLAELAHGENNG